MITNHFIKASKSFCICSINLQGTYGVVYKAFDKEKNSLVAIKKVRLEAEDEGVPATTVREIATLRELEHPNIVLYVDFC